ncbi:MAG: LysM peptidoglycan-binding domain-containing protein [Phascolarctobacterium sp.]|nr:LysM peptidoglycan-binding domain-containing protein [Phascolarctobacterium sp.]MBQ7759663.1 LysM peptidoglycan-binding domain-containing protein [Acidaminococcaceae bacterium]
MNMVFADEPVYYNQKVTVHSGDTMWSIAHRWSDDKEDVREVMHRICEANNLKSKHIYPGQVLTIPVKAVTQNDFMLAGK